MATSTAKPTPSAQPSKTSAKRRSRFSCSLTSRRRERRPRFNVQEPAATPVLEFANGAAAAPAIHAAKKPAAASLSEQVAMLKQVAGAIGKDEAKKIIDLL